MNKTAIKNFAVEARKKLIASVIDKAGLLGITKEEIKKPEAKGEGFEVYKTHAGTENTIYSEQIKYRASLVNKINEKGFQNVVEEVAYTWFNRIIAVRFMEVNDYLPSRVRVLSSETDGKNEPDIVTLAPKVDLEFNDNEIEATIKLKEENKLDELFQMLFIKQCNELGQILPELFEQTSDYTEMLLNISFINEDGVIRDLMKIDESDFLEAVEIIGWMYQYYNSEPKDETFALLKKNVKITKERIPAVTQLFTPDWIVRYMVENSLGRLWVEKCTIDNVKCTIKENWKYYLEEAEQTEEVKQQLNIVNSKLYIGMKPEDIKVIDPCMGSGHILVYAFDVMMDIYTSCGYAERDAVKLILENNLYGLDIDDRAYQLAYFAVMMKARKYNRRILNEGIKLNLCSIQESNGKKAEFQMQKSQLSMDDMVFETANYLIDIFKDAKEYGSILNVEQRDYEALETYIEKIANYGGEDLFEIEYINSIKYFMPSLIKQAKIMSQKYDVVVTNPPYMGGSGMGAKLSDYVKKNYPDSKSDLFAVFIEKCGEMINKNCYMAMITQHAFMFLSSYEKLREKMLLKDTINMAHLGARAFEEIGGEVVQTTSWVTRKSNTKKYKATYARLVDYNSQQAKEQAFLSCCDRHTAQKENFAKIPGNPMVYWISANYLRIFETSKSLENYAVPKQGTSTGDNNIFLRLWFEVSYRQINFSNKYKNMLNTFDSKWYPVTKGGEYRKFYGNNEYVIDWQYDGLRIKNHKGSAIRNKEIIFKKALTWTGISSSNLGVRYCTEGFLFTISGKPIITNDDRLYYTLGFLCSKVADNILKMTSPTLSFEVGYICGLPFIINEYKKPNVDKQVDHSIAISKVDWDSFEISWDFKRHPLI